MHQPPEQDLTSPTLVVAAFYRFAAIDDPAALATELLAAGRASALRGTILIAQEGINATIAGSAAAIDSLLAILGTDPAFSALPVHRSLTTINPFRRFKVKCRGEIVSLGVSGIAPAVRTGTRLEPVAWNALLADPAVVVIDTRNDYEYRIGTFARAVNPSTTHFREFPRFVARQLGEQPNRPIAMFCTGGIRCEKASALLLAQGFRQVYQLDGGILRYLSEIPHTESLWSGDCFVFDDRVALDAALRPADYLQCHGCRRPLSVADRQSPGYEAGVCCPACRDELTDAQRAAFRERWRQHNLALARGAVHIGASMPASGSAARTSAQIAFEHSDDIVTA